jgi:hypothetical protein
VDQTKIHDCVKQHAEAVERGDMDAVVAEFCEEMRPQVPQIAQQALPLPVKTAEVLNVKVGDAETVALIRYSGDSGEVTIRSHWQDQGGRPLIVSVEPEAGA